MGLVGFGKYKGRPYEDMLNDYTYCKWLYRQKWPYDSIKELIKQRYSCDQCNDDGDMYGNENIYITCIHCDGKKFPTDWFS